MMPFCMVNPGQKMSRGIDRKIAAMMKEYQKTIQLLLLGAGESGKTTILKQMKILHMSEFSDTEKLEKLGIIRSNILEAISTLTEEMKIQQISLGSSLNKEFFNFISEISLNKPYDFPPEFFIATSKLWKDSGIQEVYKMQDKYQLIDNAKHFLDKVDVFADNNYIPSIQDILYCRKKTTDIQKIEFNIPLPRKYGKSTQSFWMIDVGGQRSERKKWIQVFDGIHAVLFLVSASCFDVVIREDNHTNSLTESLDLFDTLWNSRFLKHTGFILFMNKQDILKEKVKSGRSIKDHFPDYADYQLAQKDRVSGEILEYLKVRCFIRDMFFEITQRINPEQMKRQVSIVKGMTIPLGADKPRELYSHFTVATDTQNIKHVFNDVQNMIMMWNLREIGMT